MELSWSSLVLNSFSLVELTNVDVDGDTVVVYRPSLNVVDGCDVDCRKRSSLS